MPPYHIVGFIPYCRADDDLTDDLHDDLTYYNLRVEQPLRWRHSKNH